jgi:DNA polymerase III psi subunit
MVNSTVFKLPDLKNSLSQVHGKGLRQLLVVCDNSTFTDDDETTLKKLIGAIKHDFENDIYLIYVNKQQNIHLSSLNLPIEKVLCFGVKPEEIGLNINEMMYTILDFENLQILFSDSIQTINSTPSKKSELWQLLQQMFLNP